MNTKTDSRYRNRWVTGQLREGFETLTEHLGKTWDRGMMLPCTVPANGIPKITVKPFHGKAKLHYIPLETNGIQKYFHDSWSILHGRCIVDSRVTGAWSFRL